MTKIIAGRGGLGIGLHVGRERGLGADRVMVGNVSRQLGKRKLMFRGCVIMRMMRQARIDEGAMMA